MHFHTATPENVDEIHNIGKFNIKKFQVIFQYRGNVAA